MHPASQHRTVLTWVQPTRAERYEIYSELGIPQAVLTINTPFRATIESRFGVYWLERKTQFAALTVSEADGSLIATVRTGWWGRREVTFEDGRKLRFNASGLFRSRWIWRNADGEPRAVVQRSQIFFSPDRPMREGLSALLTGLSIYFIANRSSIFHRF
ncbi:hypothetical protein LX87_03973 [Larkinella arboricola]|uniref:Uncharacterized protein n=1 Tax=Larkinella arboricola TaxID=643671 RepID=A0A327WQ61_LARAB|nr:hypothetical protein [Larkinella arboricola]RAJ94089.1 hypothetical protein LX87_03973 [Larkinella arboricola]